MTQSDNLDRCRSSPAAAPPGSDTQLRCPCHRPGGADPDTLITCQYCLTQQHAVCFGFAAAAPAAHCCAACHDADPRRRPSDAKLVELDAKRRECLRFDRQGKHFTTS